MKRIIAISFISLLALAIYSCTQGEQKVSLRFKYEPGTVLIYEQFSKSSSVVTCADSIVKESSQSYTVDVEQDFTGFIDDTTSEIIEHATFKWVGPSKEDTTKLDTTSRVQEITFHILPNGKILSFEFTEKPDPSRYQILKNYYEQGMPVFPDGEKSVGYSWTQSTKVMLPDETMDASTTYEIKSLVREAGYDCVIIEYKGNLVLPVIANPKDTLQRSGIRRVQSDGLLYFAYKEGLVILQTEHWEVDADMRQLKDGEMHDYKARAKYDARYSLVRVDTKS